MPRTPDRFPGEREDTGLALRDAGLGDPSTQGNVRYVTDRFRFVDVLGTYNGRPIFVGSAAPTSTDDNSSGYGVGMLWLDTTTSRSYICQDDTNSAAVWVELRTKRVTAVQFMLTEDVNNTIRYFTAWRSPGADTPGQKRSGAFGNPGIQNANTLSPYQVPWDATITSAFMVLRGAGVQNGSVTYPVAYETDLYDIGFTAATKIADIDFSISNSFTVGTWSVGTTDYSGSVSLNIDVDEGQLLGLEFRNGTGASVVGQTRNAFITMTLEER